MPRVALRQLGQYDAAFEATVEPDGRWRLDGGSYITRGTREGRLGRRAHADLMALVEAVDLDAAHPLPAADGFVTRLSVGGQTLEWWGPPPTAALRALYGALICLGKGGGP